MSSFYVKKKNSSRWQSTNILPTLSPAQKGGNYREEEQISSQRMYEQLRFINVEEGARAVSNPLKDSVDKIFVLGIALFNENLIIFS